MANSSESVKQELATELPPPQPSPTVTTQPLNDNGQLQESAPEPIVPDAEAIVKSVSELGGLAAVIQTFKLRFDELQNHLNFIDKSIHARFKDLTGSSSSPTRLPMVSVNAESVSIETIAPKNDDSDLKHDVGDKEQPKGQLEHFCRTMCSRSLRKHILSRLSDVDKLREEVPAALKLATNPAKLVFECIGRFFLQGSRAYTKGSHMATARQASVLVMEFFLLMMGDCADGKVEIDPSVQLEAKAAALAWRKRLVSEGGVRKACLLDARGLLLLIACFGIPIEFRSEDVRALIVLSNPSEISEALRHSRILVPKIPDIIEAMLKYGLYVEAVDVVYSFGIADKHPPQRILTSFLREAKESSKKIRRDASLPEQIEAKVKQLDGLKSITKCLENHKVDPTNVIPGWQIKEMMINLEKEIAEINQKILDNVAQKRKMDETEASLCLRSQELKRSRFTGNDISPLISQPIIGLHESRTSIYADGTRLSTGIGSHYPSLYSGIHGHSLVGNAGHIIHENVPSYTWRGSGSAVFGERSIGRSYAEQHAYPGMGGLSSSIEGFAGLPNHSSMDAAGRGPSSDLYKFADL